ncbi:MAG: Gfo/Idh/MocA family oxidoreductase [Clostridia bacterium]|nr:Gfo/Idh/MocA family oxidoreductase [Clostridia bacterium]
MANKKTTCVIIGCGDRGMRVYASLIKTYPDKMEIVACAEPDPDKRQKMIDEYKLSKDACFENGEALLEKGKLADVCIITTLDKDHYKYAVPAMKMGYHLLLEKPVSPVVGECVEIAETAKKYGRYVVVCHVLRYTPFYRKIKEIVDSGKIGDIISVQAIEPVGYWHQAHSFVRGNWRNSVETSPMILQKCCHDFDIFVWLMGKKCKSVSSFGSTSVFKPDTAPEGAKERCLDGCPYYDTCNFSVKHIYQDRLRDGHDEWPVSVVCTNPTKEKLEKALREGPYGRCVYHCDNDVVDHQVVNLLMEDNSTVNFTMCAFTKDMDRRITLMGTKGMLYGDIGHASVDVRLFGDHEPEKIDVSKYMTEDSGHSGGDSGLMKDFIELITEGKIAPGITSVDVSLESHYIALAAEESRINGGQVVNIADFIEKNNK